MPYSKAIVYEVPPVVIATLFPPMGNKILPNIIIVFFVPVIFE